MITISDPAIQDNPIFVAAATLESRADPGPGIPWDQMKVEA